MLGGITEDALCINVVVTPIMETGAWVEADEYTGRIGTVANCVVSSECVFDYPSHGRHLSGEIKLAITCSSDLRESR